MGVSCILIDSHMGWLLWLASVFHSGSILPGSTTPAVDSVPLAVLYQVTVLSPHKHPCYFSVIIRAAELLVWPSSV